MKTNVLKKISAYLLVFMMMISIMPLTTVFAGTLEPTYLPEVKRKVEDRVNIYMDASNSTTKEEIEQAIQKEIDIESGLRGETFLYEWITEPVVTPAEIGKNGWINGKLKISAQGYSDSVEATIRRVLAMLPFDDVWYIDNALSRVNAAIKKAEFTNDTTKETILTLLKDPAVLVYKVTAAWKADPIITLATKDDPGSVKGTLVLTLNNETRDVVVDKVIAQLPKTDKDKVDEAKPLAETALGAITATNETTDATILDAVTAGIASVDGVTATWKTGSPVIDPATSSKAGSITGTIVLTCGSETVEITVNKSIDKLAHIHEPSTTWSKDETNHWHECTANDGEKMNQAAHTPGNWILDKEPTATEEGKWITKCTVCDYVVDEETIPVIIIYEVIKGANGTWIENSEKGLPFTVTGEADKLQDVYVDGDLLNAKNYTVKSGSTIITLHSDYLKTLKAGTHELYVLYDDGVASAEFVIKGKTESSKVESSKTESSKVESSKTESSKAESAKTESSKSASPKTGDSGATMTFVVLFGLSAGTLAVLLKRKRNR